MGCIVCCIHLWNAPQSPRIYDKELSSVIKWSGGLRAKENSGIADLSEHWQMEPAAWPLHSFYCDCDDTIDAIEKDMEMAVCEDSDDEMNMIVM